MKTADLIAQLEARTARVPPGQARRRLTAPVIVGLVVAVIAVFLWLGVRSLEDAVITRAFWMKAAYTAVLALAAAGMTLRAGRPGASAGAAPWLAIAAVSGMTILSAVEFVAADPSQRLALWLGASWSHCPFRILSLATPIYLGAVLGLRRLAPTRPARAGAAAGFLAGALGATAYQLHCPETGAMFVATWYSLGVLASALIGAVGGAFLLRWRI